MTIKLDVQNKMCSDGGKEELQEANFSLYLACTHSVLSIHIDLPCYVHWSRPGTARHFACSFSSNSAIRRLIPLSCL